LKMLPVASMSLPLQKVEQATLPWPDRGCQGSCGYLIRLTIVASFFARPGADAE